MEPCTSCDGSVTVARGAYRLQGSALKNVYLAGIEIAKCESCGAEEPIIPNVNGLMECLAQAVILRQGRLQPDEIRFLRKFLGMSGETFARWIGADKHQVSKYESGAERPGRARDRLIRLAALTLADWKHEKTAKEVQESIKAGGFSDGPPRGDTYRYDEQAQKAFCE